jgi:hypothetical protein
LLRLDVLGKSRDLANGGIHSILRPATSAGAERDSLRSECRLKLQGESRLRRPNRGCAKDYPESSGQTR